MYYGNQQKHFGPVKNLLIFSPPYPSPWYLPINKINFFAISFRYYDIIHSSRVLSIPLIRCDDQVFNGIIKKETIDNQVFNGTIKEETIDETDHHNDSQLLQKGYDLNIHHSIIFIFTIKCLYFSIFFLTCGLN